MEVVYLGIGLLIGLLVGAFIIDIFHKRKIQQISNALDLFKNGKEVLKLEVLREGRYAFLYNELTLLYERTESAVQTLHQDKVEMKEYLADISHQLKTPLAAMITYLELLYRSEQRANERDMISSCMYLSEKMDSLIRSLLDLARFDAGEIIFQYTSVDLRQFLQAVINDVLLCNFKEMPEIKLEVVSSNDSKGFLADIDEHWMFQAVQNVIKNSIYYGGKPPKVFVSLYKKGNMAEIRIQDNGEGIEEQNRDAIFKRFYRAGKGKREGYGIGLALAKAVVEKQGGNLFVENREGACFVIQLFQIGGVERINLKKS